MDAASDTPQATLCDFQYSLYINGFCFVCDAGPLGPGEEGSPMIEVENLTKRYGPTLAVSEVTFQAQKGEVLGFLGPNGAGKTTTMRVITGYLPPSAGRVRVAGYDVVEEPLEAKRRTGYLPETPPVYPDMTVAEYLAFVARIKGVSRRDIKTRLDSIVEKCAVADVRNRQIGKLSKGYRQRVGLAQALIHNPEVLVLDE